MICPQQFSLSTDYYNLYRERSAFSDIDIQYRNTVLNSSFNLQGTNLSFNLGTSKAYFLWTHRPEDLRNNFEAEQKYSSILFQTAYKNFFIDSKFTLNSMDSRITLDYSVLFGLRSILNGSFETDLSFRKISIPFSWNLSYRSDGFDIITGNTFYTAGTNISGNAFGHLFRISYERSLAGTDNSKGFYSVTSKPDYYDINLEIKDKNAPVPYLFSIGKTFFSMRSDLLINSVQFSTLKVTEFSDIRIGAGITPYIMKVPLNFSTKINFYTGSLTGNAQSWPFTNLIQTLVENRINFRLNGSINIFQASASSDLSTGNLTFRPEITGYYLIPNLKVQSWQPVYLAFGIKNYTETSEGIISAWISRIGITADYKFDIAELSIMLNQLIPIYFNRETTKQEPSSGAPIISTPSGPGKKSSGGTFISVAVKKTF